MSPGSNPSQFQQNLGNVVALIKGPNPPAKTYIFWAAEIDPTDPEIVEIRQFNFTSGNWEPVGANVNGGPIDAKLVHVKLVGVTERIGARAAADFDGTLQQLLEEERIGYLRPYISFFTFQGSGSVVRPVGYSYPSNDYPFAWGTTNPSNVSAAGLTLSNLTVGQPIATQLAPTDNQTFAVAGFVVKLGESQHFRLEGVDVKGAAFQQDIVISGGVYRYAFVSDQKLLDPALYPASALSAFLRTQSGDLVPSRATGPAIYQPRSQWVYFVFDTSLLDNSQLGAAFQVQGQPNNDFLTRDFTFTNEFGAQNTMRVLRTGNLLNGGYTIQSA
jgi:hypothetical protein